MIVSSDRLNISDIVSADLSFSELIENSLKRYLSGEDEHYDKLWQSMRYSVSAGGKRVRPLLTLEFCKLCGGDPASAVPFACGVELIHTYSLIHDDLPCMDNDDMRRGQPSNHIAFSEDTALLAGDALQSLAFEIMLCEDTLSRCDAKAAATAAFTLANYCGADGMVGGQVIDLEYEDKHADESVVSKIHLLKTSALIKAACLMGCIVAGADSEKLAAAEKYAECIGLAFQIVDDVLDVTSTTEELGKPVNSDADNDKSTMVSLLGVEECLRRADSLTAEALTALDAFDGDSSFLRDFATKLSKRRN
ncbi:MAG: polyprenyl synthetase family protein [Clostridia bacterium]|nr:polyprenyl synthetase family protein [Clostridia bacterium]